jgi:hypothetical protein
MDSFCSAIENLVYWFSTTYNLLILNEKLFKIIG